MAGIISQALFLSSPSSEVIRSPSQYQRGDPRGKVSEPVKWQGCNNKRMWRVLDKLEFCLEQKDHRVWRYPGLR
jgi:hypothetical protein